MDDVKKSRVAVQQDIFQQDVQKVLEELLTMLTAKNIKYGDAALNPRQTFSRSSNIELLNVRIDDKLSRIRNRQDDEDEDPEWDLLGYLVLKRIAVKRAKAAEEFLFDAKTTSK